MNPAGCTNHRRCSSSLAEHMHRKHGVVRSSRTSGSTQQVHCRQSSSLVERVHGKHEVVGSKPTGGSSIEETGPPGGTGRHAVLRGRFQKEWGFEAPGGHQRRQRATQASPHKLAGWPRYRAERRRGIKAPVAQGTERGPPKAEDGGSRPPWRSRQGPTPAHSRDRKACVGSRGPAS